MKMIKFIRGLLMFTILSIGSISASWAGGEQPIDTGQSHFSTKYDTFNLLEATNTDTLKETIKKLRDR